MTPASTTDTEDAPAIDGPLITAAKLKKPALVAELYLEDQWLHQGTRSLQLWQGGFWAWQGDHYVSLPEGRAKNAIYRWLILHTGGNATDRDRDRVYEALCALCDTGRAQDPPDAPFWVDTGESNSNIVSLANGLLDVEAAATATTPEGKLGALQPHTPRWFTPNTLPITYDPEAQCPRWLAFLDEALDADAERIALLQEWFGLCITPDTCYQKILLLHGPPRSGKGTTTTVLRALVGEHNHVGSEFSSLIQPFGLQNFLHKTVAVFGDAHMGDLPARRVLERLKAISGGDVVPINRKYKPEISVRLTCRIIIATNEEPSFDDREGALASRLLFLPFMNSCEGREDPTLEAQLLTELSGILNWAIAGLQRLRQQGHFTTSAVGSEALNAFRVRSNSALVFARKHLAYVPDALTSKEAIWRKYQAWCSDEGLTPLSRNQVGTAITQIFGNRVRTVRPYGKPRHYANLAFQNPSTS